MFAGAAARLLIQDQHCDITFIQALEAGALDLLTKPVTPGDLQSSFRFAVGLARQKTREAVTAEGCAESDLMSGSDAPWS